jgi:signal transduction histidine kinase
MKAPRGGPRTDDFRRLTTLYSISKKLSVFARVEESFAEILECAAESFPLSTAVLIEHWERRPRMTIWFAEGTPKEVVARAIENAKEAYTFLADGPAGSEIDLGGAVRPESVLRHNDLSLAIDTSEAGCYIALPLIIDNLHPLGALQLEGAAPLDEKDLEFVSALTNLVTVAIDRSYKTLREREARDDEARENLKILYNSQDKVETLESERELREAFVSLLIHDLITPLSIVLGAAQMILRKPEDSAAHLKSARMIEAQAHRAGQMISDLLDANRIRSGEALALNKTTVDLAALVAGTLSDLAIVHGPRFAFEAPGRIDALVDARGVRRIVENLCNNAIKYGAANAPVTVALTHTETHVTLTVTNRGNAIPAEEQGSLFHQFRRTRAAQAGKKKGWGIGLTLVRGVAEAHGGIVTVFSDRENGTVFSVTLPRDARG